MHNSKTTTTTTDGDKSILQTDRSSCGKMHTHDKPDSASKQQLPLGSIAGTKAASFSYFRNGLIHAKNGL